MKRSKGKPLFPELKYCVRCCMPETEEDILFDEEGICQSCQSSEQKMHINWVEREQKLKQILDEAKEKAGNNYDCIVPISGGKDSFFQMHVLTKIYEMNPLAVTFSHNWYSETGWYNLQNCLETFNVDHIMYTPNRDLVNRLTKKSLEVIGDTCWHCHAGVGAFPLHIAAKFNIPLLIWGESIAEASGRASYFNPVHKFDRDYFTKVSAKVKPDKMVCDYIAEKELILFEPPTADECEEAGVFGIHLGDYIFWDDERQTEFIKEHYGWRETQMEGAYKRYKSAECIMAGMHDFTCYLKRGFGRATFQACADVKNGLLTREEGFRLISKHDPERPEALDYFLQITGMTEKDFYEVMEMHRLSKLKNADFEIREKNKKNTETIYPFPLQVVDRLKKMQD